MPTFIPGTNFGEALVALRHVKKLQQQDLARTLGLVPRTLTRWERGDSMPGVDVRDKIVNWLRAQSGPEAQRALLALGALFVLPAAAALPPSARTLSAEETKRATLLVEHALYKAAEAVDVAPRAARQIAIAALEAAEAEGLSPAQARGMLSAAKAK